MVFKDADIKKNGFVHTPRINCHGVLAGMRSEQSPKPTACLVAPMAKNDDTIIFKTAVQLDSKLPSNCRKERKTPFRANVEVEIRCVTRKD
jgi:hypothetical protein